MTSSSYETHAITRGGAMTVAPAPQLEISTGTWTQTAYGTISSDAASDAVLSGLADQAKAAGSALGYAQGWAEGRRAAEDRARQEEAASSQRLVAEEAHRRQGHQSAVRALETAAERLHQATAHVCAGLEQQVTALAFRLVEEILGRELALASSPGTDAVRRALALVPEDPVVTLRMHPDDICDETLELCPAGTRVVADTSLSRGDAIAELESGVIDARVSTATARVREVWR